MVDSVTLSGCPLGPGVCLSFGKVLHSIQDDRFHDVDGAVVMNAILLTYCISGVEWRNDHETMVMR